MVGLLGTKIGMTQVFDDTGAHTPVTVIQVEPNTVVGERTREKDGYAAVILGYGRLKASRRSKPYAGQFAKLEGIEPCRVLREVKDFDLQYKVGAKIGLEAFEGVRFVDVQGVSKGKGFQGVMKRHNFAGGNKSHGSLGHRGPGSTGNAWASTFPGTKMAGRMGAVKTLVQNLRLVRMDREKGILLVLGAVPGRPGGALFIAKAKKK